MKTIKIFTDGGSRGNPGPSACAFTVYQNDKIIYQYAKKIGVTTNNVAEYFGVIEALKYLQNNFDLINQSTLINFFSDSQLIVNQLNGKFKIKNSNLQKLILETKKRENNLPIKICYNAVSRPLNKETDGLINQILDSFHDAFIEKKF